MPAGGYIAGRRRGRAPRHFRVTRPQRRLVRAVRTQQQAYRGLGAVSRSRVVRHQTRLAAHRRRVAAKQARIALRTTARNRQIRRAVHRQHLVAHRQRVAAKKARQSLRTVSHNKGVRRQLVRGTRRQEVAAHAHAVRRIRDLERAFRVANPTHSAARIRRAAIRGVLGPGVPHVVRPAHLHEGKFAQALDAAVDAAGGKVTKAGIFVLDQTVRPLHAIAGGAYAGLKGKSVLSAAGRGFLNKDRHTFSDVLGAAGVKNKTVRSIGGFGLDLALDPTTYLTVGGSAAAKGLTRAAERKVAQKAERHALSSGASHAEAKHAARVAVSLARRAAPETRGVTVGVRALGREAKTSGRATRAVARKTGLAKGARRVKETKPVQIGGQLIRPDFRPKTVPKHHFERVRRAQRSSRAIQSAGHRAAQDRAVAYFRALHGKDHAKIIHAVETGQLKHLAPEERKIAEAIRTDLAHVHGQELRAGLVGNRLDNYFPHKLQEKLLPAARKGARRFQRKSYRAALDSSRERKYRQPLRELESNYPVLKGAFSKDIPLTMGARLTQSATARANAHLISELNATGRQFGRKVLKDPKYALKEGEAVYEISKRAPPRKLTGKEYKQLLDDLRAGGTGDRLGELKREFGVHLKRAEQIVANDPKGLRRKEAEAEFAKAQEVKDKFDEFRRVGNRDVFQGREFRIFHEDLVAHALGPQGLGRASEATREFGRWFDRALQGKFKTLVTVPNPQYHLTNLYGDMFNAYLGDTRFLTGTAGVHSARALGRLARREKARKTLSRKLDPSGKGLRVKGKRISYDDLIDEAEQVGAIRTGFIGRDLPEVLDALGKETAEKVGQGRFARRIPSGSRISASKAGRVVTHPIDALRNAGQYREDFVRLATYIEARKRGLAPAKASEWVAKHHFDYGDLTDFERTVLRRVFPFYCVPTSHEILTREGFKRHDELVIGEDVMALDHDTGRLVWTPLEDVATFDYDGELRTFERRGSKFLFTDDHRWPVITDRTFTKGKWYGGERKIVRTHELQKNHQIPIVGEYDEAESVLTPRQASILGWLIGDGYFRWRGNHCEMLVYQSPRKHLDEISELLGTTPRKPHPDTGVCAVPVTPPDTKALTRTFRSKQDLRRIVGQLSREAAEAMWDALFKAEGWTTERGQQGFAQSAEHNPEVLEAFQMLTLMTGRTCNLNARGAYVRTAKTFDVAKGIGSEHYQGQIWCPKTKYGTWIMRHEGAVIPTGNTFTARNTPLQVGKLLTRPGKFATLEKVRVEAAKAAGLPTGYESNLPDYQQRGQPIPIPGITDGRGNPLLLFAKLPSTDLGRLAPDAQEQFQYLFQMLSPFIGVPLELGSGQSFFFREPIDKLSQQSGGDVQDYAAAPSWFANGVKTVFGNAGLRAFGISQQPLRKGEKQKSWVWPKKWAYLYGHLGPAAATAARVGSGENQAGQTAGKAVLAFLTGLKLNPYDPKKLRQDALWKERDRLDARAQLLRRQGRKGTTEYRRTLDKLNGLNKQLYGGPGGSSSSGSSGGGWWGGGSGSKGAAGWWK